MTKGRVFAALAAIVAGILISQTVFTGNAAAQYPPPQGSLVCAIANIDVKIDDTLQVTATLRDTAGRLVAGEVVTFTIIEGRAHVSPSVTTTNASGVAVTTLSAGDSLGRITVLASSRDVSCRAVAEVLSVTSFQPPKTGSGGLIDPGTDTLKRIAYLLIGVDLGLLVATGFAFIIRRRLSGSSK
jgi:hypothetical protein